jgi:hypothetical protein
MKLRSLVTIASIAVSGIAICGVCLPAQAVGVLLTSEVGYTGPGLDLSPYANSSYNYYTSPKSIPGGITFTSTNIATSVPDSGSVLGQGDYGLVGYNGYPGNGRLDGTPVYAGLNSGTGYIQFTFNAPVREFGAFVNYGPKGGIPGVPSDLWDNPTISTYDSSSNLISSFDLSALAPIATPGNPPGNQPTGGGSSAFIEGGINQFLFRGIREDSAIIASFRIGGSNIVATGNATGSYASVPEPFTIIGTIIGGTAALRLRKKLKAGN